jgi:prevent-host-death family protein
VKSITADQAKAELSRLVRHSVKGHETFQITHDDGDVVLLSREDYDVLIETLEVLSDPAHAQAIPPGARRSH